MAAVAAPASTYSGPVFPGLRPFRSNETILFFGREEQTDELLARLTQARFLAVVGLSGTGKSSLVHAGLVPALQRGSLVDASSRWRVATMTPGIDPLGAAARALNKALGESDARATALLSGNGGLLEASRSGRRPDENLLFVVDQFEELFRFGRDHPHRQHEAQAFVSLLLSASENYSDVHRIYVVLTMRSDYLGESARFPGLIQALNEGQYLAEPMSRSQLREAIAGPAGLAGVTIAPPLLNLLLDKAAVQQDQLPVLQHLLMRMWSVKTGNTLTLDDYHHPLVGGWENALNLHADSVYGSLNGEQKRIARKVFQRLTEKGEENRENRRPAAIAELAAVASCAEPQVREVVDAFQADECNFLVMANNSPVVDISHESLIRNRNALKDWVREEAESAAWYGRVEDHWFTNEKLSGNRLTGALDSRRRDGWNASWAERYRTQRDGKKPDFSQITQVLASSKLRRALLRSAVILAASILVILAVVAVLARRDAKQQLVDNQWQFSRIEQAAGRNLESLFWVVESVTSNSSKTQRDVVLQDVQSITPATSLNQIFGHSAPVNGALFNQDESRILTWSNDDTARLWDARTGQQIGPALQHSNSVNGARFNKDESRILTWSKDNTARLTFISADYDFPREQLKTLLQATTGTEFNAATRQLTLIEPSRWRTVKDNYNRLAAEHARICQYPEAKLWLRFHSQP